MCSRWRCPDPRPIGAAALLVAGIASQPARADSDAFDLSAGVLATGGIGWLDRPTPDELTLPRSGQRARYGALSGFVFAGGLTAEARFFRVAGLEIDALLGRDRVAGDVEVDGRPAHLSVSQPALHLAVLGKGVLPLDGISPFVVLGPELVFPGLPDAEADPPLRSVATAERYTLLTAGAGVELTLHENLGLRAPLGLRFSYAPGLGDDLSDRVRALPSDAVITTSEVRYQVLATAGLTMTLL
jgi:hypothetical protein